MVARIVIGSNNGDEAKGTIVARYTKNTENKVLNILTNGGAQRGHSIVTEKGEEITFQHFGSGTYHGADNYYSRYFIINPIQFVQEYNSLIVKPEKIYRHSQCRWSTPFDSFANYISESLKKRQASCCMGIWNTIRRSKQIGITFDEFIKLDYSEKLEYLLKVKRFYEKEMQIPETYKKVWDSFNLVLHFIDDCSFLYEHTHCVDDIENLISYQELIFENGQGLLLCDTGKDTFDTTPSNTGIQYSLEILKKIPNVEITAHYVTRPYLTRHGDGFIANSCTRMSLSSDVKEDRTNHYNPSQGEFRYGKLDILDLKTRILKDSRGIDFKVEVTHCDEMDRELEFKSIFDKVAFYDTPIV